MYLIDNGLGFLQLFRLFNVEHTVEEVTVVKHFGHQVV